MSRLVAEPLCLTGCVCALSGPWAGCRDRHGAQPGQPLHTPRAHAQGCWDLGPRAWRERSRTWGSTQSPESQVVSLDKKLPRDRCLRLRATVTKTQPHTGRLKQQKFILHSLGTRTRCLSPALVSLSPEENLSPAQRLALWATQGVLGLWMHHPDLSFTRPPSLWVSVSSSHKDTVSLD